MLSEWEDDVEDDEPVDSFAETIQLVGGFSESDMDDVLLWVGDDPRDIEFVKEVIHTPLQHQHCLHLMFGRKSYMQWCRGYKGYIHPNAMRKRFRKAAHAEAFLSRLTNRANKLLSHWSLKASWPAIASAVRCSKRGWLYVVLETLISVFGSTEFAGRPWMMIRAYRLGTFGSAPVQHPDMHDPGVKHIRIIGRENLTDFVPISYRVVCATRYGAIITTADVVPFANRDVTQVVVLDPQNGERRHIGVPVWFGCPMRPGESAADRIHAAVAWTFSMFPEQYAPKIEV